MMKDYKELYFDDTVQVVSDIFEYVLNDVGLDLELFTSFFINSDVFKMIEICHPYYVGGRSGIEIAQDILTNKFGNIRLPEQKDTEQKSRFYWAGWALSQYQLFSSIPYKEIVRCVPLEEIISMYDVFHEMDISKFIESMINKRKERKKDIKLKLLRVNAGLSQRQLADNSGVSVRIIQLYEQRANDINKGQFETIMMLSRALNCSASDLYEW